MVRKPSKRQRNKIDQDIDPDKPQPKSGSLMSALIMRRRVNKLLRVLYFEWKKLQAKIKHYFHTRYKDE